MSEGIQRFIEVVMENIMLMFLQQVIRQQVEMGILLFQVALISLFVIKLSVLILFSHLLALQ